MKSNMFITSETNLLTDGRGIKGKQRQTKAVLSWISKKQMDKDRGCWVWWTNPYDMVGLGIPETIGEKK